MYKEDHTECYFPSLPCFWVLIMPWGTQDVSLSTAAFCCVSEDTKATEVWWKEASLWVATFGTLCWEGALQDHRAARSRTWSGSKTSWWELRWLVVWQGPACPAEGSELCLAGQEKPVQVLEQRNLNVHLKISTIPVGSVTKYTCILKHEPHPPLISSNSTFDLIHWVSVERGQNDPEPSFCCRSRSWHGA